MAIIQTWREPRGKTKYTSTGKEPEPHGDKVDLACWMLSGKVDDSFGGGSGTIGEIYYQVTRPLGMSLDDTSTLVKECNKRGYLRRA